MVILCILGSILKTIFFFVIIIFVSMNYILFDDFRSNLLPLTYTRPVSEIRIGILTITEKWERFLNTKCSFYTENYLQQKFSLNTKEDNLWVNGSICPDINLVNAIKSLSYNQCLKHNETLIAYRSKESIPSYVIPYEGDFMQVSQLWHIFEFNDDCIQSDFKLLTEGRTSQLISETNACTNPENIFIEDGAKVEHAILNASQDQSMLVKMLK